MARGRNMGAWLLVSKRRACSDPYSLQFCPLLFCQIIKLKRINQIQAEMTSQVTVFKRVIFALQQSRNSEKIYQGNAWTKPQIAKSSYEFCRVCKCAALKTKYGPLGSF